MRSRLFERLRHRLLLGGVAPRYVRRLVSELTDHIEAAVAEQRARGIPETEAVTCVRQRLGDESQLLSQVLMASRHRSLMRRFPLVSFVLAPAAAMLVLGLAYLNLSVGVYHTAADLAGVPNNDAALHWFGMALFYLGVYALTPLLAAWFCMLAIPRRCSLLWPALACTVLAVIGGLMVAQVQFPSDEAGTGLVQFGFGPVVNNKVRLALPLIVFVCYLLVEFRRRILARRVFREPDPGHLPCH